ncbi:kinesin-like protein KIF20A [Columba guinea]|nr:kinesin-like protein KIF20A [Columba guinea]
MDDEGKSYVSAEVSDMLESVSFLNIEGKPSPMESTVLPDTEEQEAYQPLKVFLRVRPFSVAELENHESQGCITIEDCQTVILSAPKESSAVKNSERGIGHSVHRFTFSQVFGPETTQSEFFEGSMKEIVRAYVNGVNGLVFTYGVTNAGKTFTIQGTSKDVGILPRSVDVIFNHIRGRQYPKMNFKPYLSNAVKKLEEAQAKQEEAIKSAVLASLKESVHGNVTVSYFLKETESISNTITNMCGVESTSSNCTLKSLPSDSLGKINHSIFSIRLLRLTDEPQPHVLGVSDILIPAILTALINHCVQLCIFQVIQPILPKNFDYFPPKLVGGNSKPAVHFDANIAVDDFPDSTETSTEEEVDITILSHEDLLKTTENLKEKLVAERQSKLLLEVKIRKEMAEAMFRQLLETEEAWRQVILHNRLEDMKDSYEEKLESKFEMYKEAIKKHAYVCAMEQIEDHYVPIEEFLAEQEKVEDRENKILQLERQLDEQSGRLLALGSPNPDILTTENNMELDLINKTMKRANEGLQKQCKEKEETCTVDSSMKIPANECQVYNMAQLWMTFARDWPCSGFTLVCKGIYCSNKSHGEHDCVWVFLFFQLIKALKLKIQKLNETLLEANEGYRKMAEENSQLKHTIMLKDQEMNSLQNWATRVLELEETVSSLQKELEERKKHFSVEELKQQKARKGLLANLKSTVAATAGTPLGKSWGKHEDALSTSRKHVLWAHKAKE